jgi:predicted  nucleic acid-binding Zn-ribbon protein
MLDNQNNALGQISNVIDNIKNENDEFSTEVKHQNKILTKVSNDQDELLDNMIKVDSKVKALLTKTSICRLWIVIILEIIIACFLVSIL